VNTSTPDGAATYPKWALLTKAKVGTSNTATDSRNMSHGEDEQDEEEGKRERKTDWYWQEGTGLDRRLRHVNEASKGGGRSKGNHVE
jgi:hypothetical protein